ncbi:potassium channel subfamily K member 18-like isoform X2 [Diadema antillarum]|uniref:potassium channel subfamily K member 18-like isoform X2 n=1 Tax=Diadema antillarum TaxID=105358 RepID=UPI003A89C5A4
MGNSICCRRRQSRNISRPDPKKLKRGESVFDQHPWLRKLQRALILLSLGASLLGYSFIGAAAFVALESGNEKANMDIYLQERHNFLTNLTNLTLGYIDESQDMMSSEVMEMRENMSILLKNYEEVLEEVICHRRIAINGKPKWNFYGALFFSATVISTIGYGNIAPVTPGGRVFCMVYAVFGIALLLLVLASIGTLLARGATLTYRRMHTMIQAARGEGPEEKTYQRDRRSQEIIDEIWKPPADKQADGDAPIHVVELEGKGKNGESGGTARKRRTKEEEEEPPAPEEPQIPLFIVLVFAFLYICFLALLLRVWEDQWDYFEAFYFSFITLTTIGFGDLVPIHQKNLLGCTFFILLGMAIMSMCIALAQELIIQKVSWLSKKIGVAFANKRKGSADEESS